LSITGKLTPETEKPLPLVIAELMVTGAVPVDVNVTNFDTLLFTTTLPNEMLVALILSVGVYAFSCRAKLLVALLAVAVRVTV